MSHSPPVELQNSIKALFQSFPSSGIRLRHTFVLLSILIRYKKEFLFRATFPDDGKPLFVRVLAQ